MSDLLHLAAEVDTFCQQQGWKYCIIRGIVIRQGSASLDWKYVFKHLTPLAELKEQPGIITRLQEISMRYRAP